MLLGGIGVQAELLGEATQNLGAGTGADQIAAVQILGRSALIIRGLALAPDRDLQAA